jgi:large subunit ribosomal protein L21
MKYIIARIGSRQFKLSEGDQLTVDRFDGQVDEVLLFVDDDDIRIGRPLVKNVKVKTKIVDEGYVKTEIRRFKAKSRYRRKKGHKQPVTTIRIDRIECQ